MPNTYFRREERKKQIELVLTIRAQHGKSPEGTAYTIARLLDIAVSGHLYSILTDMVAEHRLNVRDEQMGDRGTRTFYALPPGTYPQDDERTVSLRINGKVYQERLL